MTDADAAALALTLKTALLTAEDDAVPPSEEGLERYGQIASKSGEQASHWAISARLGARRGLGVATDARLELGVRYRRGHGFAGIGVAFGSGYNVVTSAFDGHLRDTTLIARAGVRHKAGPVWGSAFALGSLHRISLEGTLSPGVASASRTRVNPALGAGGHLGVDAGPLTVGLEVLTQRYTRRQRFTVRAQEVVHLPSWELRAGLLLLYPL